MPALTDTELTQVMHVALPILAGHVLMGTDRDLRYEELRPR